MTHAYRKMNWDKKQIGNLPLKSGLILAGDERIERYLEDTMMRGNPDAVLVARDDQDVIDALAYCNSRHIPVTFCGSQTSMCGASVALEGLLISTEKLEGVTDLWMEDGLPYARVRPGTVVADFQKAVADAGFFYPVAPTSRDECRIGSNIATNATGEDSYRYGPLRPYLKEALLILPSGEKRILKRGKNETPSFECNRAGYFMGWKNPIDLVIASEGTIGFVSSATFGLLNRSKDFFSALIPFPSNRAAIKFIAQTALGLNRLSARALELIDSGALKIMRTADGFPNISGEVSALVYAKQEYKDEVEKDAWLSKWYDEAVRFVGQKMADGILIANTRAKQEEFRLWRHKVPETEQEAGRKYWAQGGCKLGSDWWVPVARLEEMMDFFYLVADKAALPYIAYAHLGMGHPHTNLHARDKREKEIAMDVLKKCCKKAVELGGGVAGEHGIGKVYVDLMEIQHSKAAIERMKSWKKEYDPNWILGRGNIFESA